MSTEFSKRKAVPVKVRAMKDIKAAMENRNKGIALTSTNFVNFVRNNADKFMKVTETFAMSVAPVMNQMDRRWMLGSLFVHVITNEFPNDVFVPDGSQKGFDLLHHNGVKISVKTGTRMFQREAANGLRLGNPPSIILKNGMGHREIVNPVFDYLITVHRDYNHKLSRYEYGYGVIDKKTALNFSAPSKKGDQVISNIPNEAYNYYSGIHYNYTAFKGDEKSKVILRNEEFLNTVLTTIA